MPLLLSTNEKHEGIRHYSSSELDAISMGQNGFDVLTYQGDEHLAEDYGVKFWTEFKVFE